MYHQDCNHNNRLNKIHAQLNHENSLHACLNMILYNKNAVRQRAMRLVVDGWSNQDTWKC